MTSELRKFELPGNRISVSGRDCHVSCGFKWYKQYILKEKQRPALPLIQGSLIHTGPAFAAGEQLLGRPRPSVEAIMEHAGSLVDFEVGRAESQSGWKLDWKEEGTTIDILRADVIRAVEKYERVIGHTLVPLEAEKLFYMELPGRDYILSGKLDILDTLGFVRDIKSSGKKLDELAPVISDQLTVYQIHAETVEVAPGRKVQVTGLALDGIIMNKTEIAIQPLEVPPRTEAEKEACLVDFDQTVAAIRGGHFERVNNHRTCSWCGYLESCHPRVYKAAKEIKAAKAAAKLTKKAK